MIVEDEGSKVSEAGFSVRMGSVVLDQVVNDRWPAGLPERTILESFTIPTEAVKSVY